MKRTDLQSCVFCGTKTYSRIRKDFVCPKCQTMEDCVPSKPQPSPRFSYGDTVRGLDEYGIERIGTVSAVTETRCRIVCKDGVTTHLLSLKSLRPEVEEESGEPNAC